VFLAYCALDGARALIDRELYIPKKWAGDPDRCQAAGAGEDVTFLTKPQLAEKMIARALKAGVPFRWVAGDEVYGSSPGLREWLEGEKIRYVLAVACSAMIPTATSPMSSPSARVRAEGNRGPGLQPALLHRRTGRDILGHPARARHS